MLNPVIIKKVAKSVGTAIVTIGLPIASNYFEQKALNKKIEKVATEVFNNLNKQG